MDIIIAGGVVVKNNAAIREFKKYKSQINQIEEIIEHSKSGALIEHESSVRKKLRHLNELKIDLKDYSEVVEKYEELLEYVSQRLLEEYNKKNNTDFDFISS